MKTQYRKHHKVQFCTQLYIDICELILDLQASTYRLKTKSINSFILLARLSNI